MRLSPQLGDLLWDSPEYWISERTDFFFLPFFIVYNLCWSLYWCFLSSMNNKNCKHLSWFTDYMSWCLNANKNAIIFCCLWLTKFLLHYYFRLKYWSACLTFLCEYVSFQFILKRELLVSSQKLPSAPFPAFLEHLVFHSNPKSQNLSLKPTWMCFFSVWFHCSVDFAGYISLFL